MNASSKSSSKLGLDSDLISEARKAASGIADSLDTFVRLRSTIAVERTTLRLMGIDGVNADQVPLPNIVCDALVDADCLEHGAADFLIRAMDATGLEPQAIAEKVSNGEIKVEEFTTHECDLQGLGRRFASKSVDRIQRNVDKRNDYLDKSEKKSTPLHYVIVATGNIYEDAVQARTAAIQGADIVAVIRSTGQSLLDYVPYGPTIEGFGGTYATQENFKIVREALDDVGEELGRYIRLCNYCSGLCMPEIAAMGAIERLDVMLNDALYGILFRDINPERTFIDQYFSRMINAFAGVIINTGEDNYLTTADAVDAAHTVLASQFLNEQIAFRSGLRTEQLGLGHAMEMNPNIENGFLLELAQAEMAREIFPGAPLKYMPPTKYMTGNIFKGHLQDALFNLIGAWTNQGIQLLGMMTEAMHTPHMSDRYLALENAQYVMNNVRNLGEEIMYKPDGMIQKRAQSVLGDALKLLSKVESEGLFQTLEDGVFADVKRPRNGGRGQDGVFLRSARYFNPIEDQFRERLSL